MKFIILCFVGLLFLNSFESRAQVDASVAEKVVNSTVSVTTDKGITAKGFFVGTNVVVTNYHIMQEANEAFVSVLNSNKQYEIEGYLAVEKSVDLIILKVKELNREALSYATEAPDIGAQVYLLDHESIGSKSLKEASIIGKKELNGNKLLDIDYNLEKDHTGGPVFNAKGEIIGVSTLIEVGGKAKTYIIPKHYVDVLQGYSKDVVEPLYSLAFKDGSSTGMTITGSVCFYQNHIKNGRIDLFIDGVFVGSLDSYLTDKSYIPNCGDNGEGIKSINLPEGKYTYQAKSSESRQLWSGDLEIKEEGCEQILLKYEPKESQDCFERIQAAFLERGSKPLADGMHNDVVISFFDGGESFCSVAKARVFQNKVINIFLLLEDGNYVQYDQKFLNEKDLKPEVSNGISEMIYAENGDKFKLSFMDALNDKKKQYMEARLAPGMDCPVYCFDCLSNLFKSQGAFPVPDGMDRNVIISFFDGETSKCIEGKARVENGVITSIFMKYVDGTYEFVERKFYSKSKKAPLINEGISEMIYTETGEQFKIVFIDKLKSKENLQVWDPSKLK